MVEFRQYLKKLFRSEELPQCNCKVRRTESTIGIFKKMLTPEAFEIKLGIITWLVILGVFIFYFQIGGLIVAIGLLGFLTLAAFLARLAVGHQLSCALKNSLKIAFGLIGFWPNGL